MYFKNENAQYFFFFLVFSHEKRAFGVRRSVRTAEASVEGENDVIGAEAP